MVGVLICVGGDSGGVVASTADEYTGLGAVGKRAVSDTGDTIYKFDFGFSRRALSMRVGSIHACFFSDGMHRTGFDGRDAGVLELRIKKKSEMMILQILGDMLFSALAAVGFAAISHPPRGVLKFCGLIAAFGHASRTCLIEFAGWHIVAASFAAAVIVGLLAIIIAPRLKCPPETFSFPSLLPMIPGIYAYRTIQALVMSLTAGEEDAFEHWFYLFESNGLITAMIVLAMVIGQMLPIFLFPRISFTSTK